MKNKKLTISFPSITAYMLGILLLALSFTGSANAGWTSYGHWHRMCRSPAGDKVVAHFTRTENATYNYGAISVGNNTITADLRDRTSDLIEVSANSLSDTISIGIGTFGGGGKGGGGFTVGSLAICDTKSFSN